MRDKKNISLLFGSFETNNLALCICPCYSVLIKGKGKATLATNFPSFACVLDLSFLNTELTAIQQTIPSQVKPSLLEFIGGLSLETMLPILSCCFS